MITFHDNTTGRIAKSVQGKVRREVRQSESRGMDVRFDMPMATTLSEAPQLKRRKVGIQ